MFRDDSSLLRYVDVVDYVAAAAAAAARSLQEETANY